MLSIVYDFIFRENKVWKRTIQCCLLNGGVFCGSILLFDHLLLPFLLLILRLILGSSSTYTQFYWTWINLLLSWTFNALWVLPLFTLSKVINCLWFQVSCFRIYFLYIIVLSCWWIFYLDIFTVLPTTYFI